jgi:hypothetical protein
MLGKQARQGLCSRGRVLLLDSGSHAAPGQRYALPGTPDSEASAMVGHETSLMM